MIAPGAYGEFFGWVRAGRGALALGLGLCMSLLLACERNTGTAEPVAPKPSASAGAPVPAAPAASAPQESGAGPTVLFLGDSLSAGAHLAAEEAFPAQLQRTLKAEGVPFQLANAGVSGDTSAGGLRRVDWVLRAKPAFVVVELGANDGLRGMPVAGVEQNLRAIIAKIRAQGARVMLLGMRLPPSVGADYAREFDAIYPRIASETGVAYVPFFLEGVAGIPELNLPDGLHPTAEGHARIAEKLRAPFRRWLSGS
jgi:acyl-CoA thioesterase-1